MVLADDSDVIPTGRPRALLGHQLNGRVALVTGGTRGIGAAIARSLAAEGAGIAVGYSRNPETANAFAADIREAFGETAITVHCGNVGVPEDCRRVVKEVLQQHGRIDVLVNNAGITIDKTVLNLDDGDWHKVIDVNLSGAFFLSQAVIEHMVERGSGRIINVSSVVGETGNIGQANYTASKSGLFGLTKTLAREVAFMLQRAGKITDGGPGVTVNTVSPGYIATEMAEAIPEKVIERVTAQIPARRFGRPEEVARVVHFLVSDASSYINGQVWGVNGGFDM